MPFWTTFLLFILCIPIITCYDRALQNANLPISLRFSNQLLNRKYSEENNDFYLEIPKNFYNYTIRIEFNADANLTERLEKQVDIALVAKSLTPVKRNLITNLTQINSYFDKIDLNALLLKKKYHYILLKPDDYVNNDLNWYFSIIQTAQQIIDFNYTIKAEYFEKGRLPCPNNCSEVGFCHGVENSCECPRGYIDEDCSKGAIELNLKVPETIIVRPNAINYFVARMRGTTNKFELIVEKNSSRAFLEIYIKNTDSPIPYLPVKGSGLVFTVEETEISKRFRLEERLFETTDSNPLIFYIGIRIYNVIDVAVTVLLTPQTPAIIEENFQTVHLIIILVLGGICILISFFVALRKYSAVYRGTRAMGNKKLTAALVEKYLPLKSFKEIEEWYPESLEKPNCSVCLAEFIPDDKCRMCICFHIFHSDCIDSWLLFHENCPYCRKEMSVAKLEEFQLICTEDFLEKNKRHNKIKQESLKRGSPEQNHTVLAVGNQIFKRGSKDRINEEEAETFLLKQELSKNVSETNSIEKPKTKKAQSKNKIISDGGFFSKKSGSIHDMDKNLNLKKAKMDSAPKKQVGLARSNSSGPRASKSKPNLDKETFSDIGDYFTKEENLKNSENPRRALFQSKLSSLKAKLKKKNSNDMRESRVKKEHKAVPAMIKTKVKLPELKTRSKKDTEEEIRNTLDTENYSEKQKINNSGSLTAIRHHSSNHDKEHKKPANANLITPIVKTASLKDSLTYFEIPNTEHIDSEFNPQVSKDNDKFFKEMVVKRNNLFSQPFDPMGSYKFNESSSNNIEVKSNAEDFQKMQHFFKKGDNKPKPDQKAPAEKIPQVDSRKNINPGALRISGGFFEAEEF